MTLDVPKELDAMTTKLDAMIDQSIEAHVLDGLTWERFADVMINAKTVLEKAQEVYKEASDNSELACYGE